MMQGLHIFLYQLHNPTSPILSPAPMDRRYSHQADLPPKAGVQCKVEIKQDNLLIKKLSVLMLILQFFPHILVP